MTLLPSSEDLDLLQVSKHWQLCTLKRLPAAELENPQAALGEFYEDFDPEVTLATFRSGVLVVRNDEALPGDLGPPLHLEAVFCGETRVLRHLYGACWRVSRLVEGDGADVLAEKVHWIGSGASGDGEVNKLSYKRYWSIEEDGTFRIIGARLVAVELRGSGEG